MVSLRGKFTLGATALFCGFVGHAQATLILSPGNPGNSGTDNVLFNNACDNIDTGPALTVQGCLNTNHDAKQYRLWSHYTTIRNGGQVPCVVRSCGCSRFALVRAR